MKKQIEFIPLFIIFFMLFTGCEKAGKQIPEPIILENIDYMERDENKYAECFAIDRYDGGYSVILTDEGGKLLVIPEGKSVPETSEDLIVIQKPIDKIYLAATSAMGLFASLDCMDKIRFSGTEQEDWYIEQAANAMKNGDMLYAGKYREPDYELLLSEDCRLSVQSTMIGHSPDVKEKLEELGIPVFVDRSSYETHPLGRSEWIKVYGEICGKHEKAEKLFDEQSAIIDGLQNTKTGKTAVFFYINSAGQAVTRKSGDYVTKMIELAGGENIFSDIGDNSGTSTITMETEQFYNKAKNADIIIYNSTVDGEIDSIEALISDAPFLADFKAVKNGNVWCTKENLFQETMKLGTVISDLNAIFTEETDKRPTEYLYRLEDGDKN